MLDTGVCALETSEQTDPDVAGTSPVNEDVGVSAVRLLPVGDTDESVGTGTSTWYFLRATGICQIRYKTHCENEAIELP